jgi:hypothetical protein
MAYRYSKPRRIRIRGQLSEHFYCRRYDTLTGKRSWISTDRTNREAAYAQKQTWETEDASGKGATTDRVFREAVAEWLELKKAKMTPRGHSSYAHHCDGWLAFFPAKATVRDINVQRVEGYFKARAAEPTSSRGRPPPR